MAFNIDDTPADFPTVEAPSAGEVDLVQGGSTTSFPGRFVWQLARRTRYLYNLIAGDTTAQQTFEVFKQIGVAGTAQGRLTLESGVPVSSADQLAATTLYYTPYNGDYIALYNTANNRWDLRQFTERSLSLFGLTANTNYDIFAFWDGDSVEMEAIAWNDSGAGTSSRNTSISQLNGIWVNPSDASRRLLGTIRTTNTGETEISGDKIFVSNLNNTIRRVLLRQMTDVGDYTYTVKAWRKAFNVDNYRIQAISPLGQNVRVDCGLIANGYAPAQAVGIQIDSTVGNSAQIYSNSLSGLTQTELVSRHLLTAIASYVVAPGFHYFQLMEWGDTFTFNSNPASFAGSYLVVAPSSPDVGTSGIIAEWEY